jgi:hypothetical protein
MPRCEDLKPFEVWTFPFAFSGDPQPQWKHWIVAGNFPAVAHVAFFKPTSTPIFYDSEPSRLLGAVEYAVNEVAVFSVRTIIPPECFRISYAYLNSCNASGELKYKGNLPANFRERMNQAVTSSVEFRKKQREDFFGWFKKGNNGD